MTEEDFQTKYHTYSTYNYENAKAEAESITLSDGRHPEVIGFPFGQNIQYCLVLPRAAKYISSLYLAS